ncbi:DUF4189 domain-containing protein [Hoeflea alexandrii]|uniref:DUF4189 domain-containing protein n=1 Tax=Hoeflea alexandrii TaxID=288436 RepID=UPI003CCD7A4E
MSANPRVTSSTRSKCSGLTEAPPRGSLPRANTSARRNRRRKLKPRASSAWPAGSASTAAATVSLARAPMPGFASSSIRTTHRFPAPNARYHRTMLRVLLVATRHRSADRRRGRSAASCATVRERTSRLLEASPKGRRYRCWPIPVSGSMAMTGSKSGTAAGSPTSGAASCARMEARSRACLVTAPRCFAARRLARVQTVASGGGWMAFAIGANGRFGHGAGASRQEAQSYAMQYCGDASCGIEDMTQAQCHALVGGNRNGHWFGAGNSKRAAESFAMGFCSNAEGSCAIRYSHCR